MKTQLQNTERFALARLYQRLKLVVPIGWELRTKSSTPCQARNSARVTMKLGIPTLATRKPVTTPTAAPRATAPIIARVTLLSTSPAATSTTPSVTTTAPLQALSQTASAIAASMKTSRDQ